MRKVKLSVYWPDDQKTVTLRHSEWEIVISGQSFSKSGDGYYYDGEFFQDTWLFNNGEDELQVLYGDDGGVGFIGDINDAQIEFINYKLLPKFGK